eukprot:4667905-Pleurochrysis_carterae.AAC.1
MRARYFEDVHEMMTKRARAATDMCTRCVHLTTEMRARVASRCIFSCTLDAIACALTLSNQLRWWLLLPTSSGFEAKFTMLFRPLVRASCLASHSLARSFPLAVLQPLCNSMVLKPCTCLMSD